MPQSWKQPQEMLHRRRFCQRSVTTSFDHSSYSYRVINCSVSNDVKFITIGPRSDNRSGLITIQDGHIHVEHDDGRIK